MGVLPEDNDPMEKKGSETVNENNNGMSDVFLCRNILQCFHQLHMHVWWDVMVNARHFDFVVVALAMHSHSFPTTCT